MDGLAACACGTVADELEACTRRAPGDNPVVTSKADNSDRAVKRASGTVDRGMLFLPPTFSDPQGARDDGLWVREQGERTTSARSRSCNARLAPRSSQQPEATKSVAPASWGGQSPLVSADAHFGTICVPRCVPRCVP